MRSPQEAISLWRRLLATVAALHRSGPYGHAFCDLKPSNVYMYRLGGMLKTKFIDYGFVDECKERNGLGHPW